MSFLSIIFANSLDQVQARLTSMDVIVSHMKGTLLARAVILISCALFINGTSLIEEGSDLNSLLKGAKSFLSGPFLMFGKAWFPH